PTVRRIASEPRSPRTESLDDRLNRLAERSSVSAQELIDALAEIANDKLARYGGGDRYVAAPELSQSGSAESRLAHRAAALQRTTVRAADDAFPVVFVEYFAGQRDVYGLSWQVRGDPPAVDEMHVWHVMGRDELARTTPEAMRSKYGRLDGGFAQ